MGELQRLLHDPVFHRLGLTLVHFLWQGLALALLALLLRALLRRAAPTRRYLTLLGLFVTMAAAPVLTFALGTKAPPPAVMTMVEMQRLLATTARQPPAPSPGTTVPAPGRALRPSLLASAGSRLRALWWRVRRRLPVAGLLWMAGVVALSFRLLVQWGSFLRVVRRARPLAEEAWQRMLASLCARLEVRRAVRLLRSVEVGMPTAAGWLRPVILLPPAALLGLTPEQLEAVLAHELAHLRRHDFLVNVFQRVVEVLLFYHPAVWWVSGLIRLERELCCDDLVVAVCGDRVTYARALEALESRRGGAPEPAVAAARGPVVARVRRLVLAVEADRRPPSWSTVLFPTLALTAIILTAGMVPVGGQPYIVGTLMWQESAAEGRGTYWESYGEVARVIRGRTRLAVEAPAPVHLLEFSPRGDEALTPHGPGAWRRTDAITHEQQTRADPTRCGGYTHIWKVKLDAGRRPDYSRAVDLIEKAGIGGDNGIPRWSPDGRRFLFLHYDGCWKLEGVEYGVKYPPELWVMNADGTGAHEIRVPDHEYSNNGTAQWADRSHILFGGRRRGPGDISCGSTSCRLVLFDVDSGRSRDLPLRYGSMSPDGRSIVGVWMDPPHGVIAVNEEPGWRKPRGGEYVWRLMLMRPDGTGQRVLLQGSEPLANLPADPCAAAICLTPRELTWSPDGRQFAFIAALDWDRQGVPIHQQVELYLYDLPSGRLSRLTHDHLVQLTPVWME